MTDRNHSKLYSTPLKKATGKIESLLKAEQFTKPGTANVSPADLKRLRPLLEHYRKKPHPFRSCFRDQVKHGLSRKHAARRCAVLKDLIHGSTNWRGKSKVVKSSGEWTPEVVETIDRIAKQIFPPNPRGSA